MLPFLTLKGDPQNKERERPSARERNSKLSELRGASQYTQSMQEAQTSIEESRETVDVARRQVQDLQHRSTEQQQLQTQQQDHHEAGDELNMQAQDATAHNRLLNIVLIGDGGVGKSCISVRYSDESFTSAYKPTVGRYYFRGCMHYGGLELNI